MEEDKKLARKNRICIRKQKRPKFSSKEFVDTTIIGNASQKGKTKESLTDITNRLNFPRFRSTPIKSYGQVSSSHSQAQYPNSMQEHYLQYGLSSSNLQKEHLLPDLNEIPLFQDVSIDGDIPGHMQSNVQIHDENEDGDVFEGDEVQSWMTNEGDANYECEYCGAYFWFEERVDKKYKNKKPVFTLCCGRGKIKLPNPKEPPSILKDLLFGSGAKSKHFRENIRTYNSIFSFTSMGGKVDVSVNKTKGPRTFRLSGQNYYQIGSLLPPEGSSPKFTQLYIYDTENEVNNRINAIRIIRDQFQEDRTSNVRLRLIGKRCSDGRRYNLPTVSEVAALIIGDFEQTRSDRDIIVESQSGQLQRINELNASYLGLQYPLLFPYGEDGYREDIPLNDIDDSTGGRKCVSTREYLSYKIQERKDEVPTIVSTRRLFQQFLVDGYTMMESSRLRFIRLHQKQLRAHFYKGLQDAVLHGDIEPSSQGQRVILSSSFMGGARYMLQIYQDAMAICKWAGYPDLFITFTCNPKWPEIIRFVESRGLSPEDRPNILTRVFKIKLDRMIKDLRDNKVFGEVKAVIYTVEFQKRGLPHAHILLFLRNKYPNVADIDGIISAELPDKKVDPHYYNAVTNFMMHGPCGAARKSSPCMQNGRCTKHFPKKIVSSTTIDEDEYPIYRRRDDGRTAKRVGIELDN
uniref:Uncharacterized protein LOC104218829 n=1 Tax=Nicotiana sylvestris TaxID=4096 RepID=A0A1U7VMW3_NICSY